jgi:GxxExxY protein
MTELLHKDLTEKIISVYYKLYNGLSHTYPEFIYERAFSEQLRKLGIQVIRQDEYQIFYKDKLMGIQRLDLFVARDVVVEIKVVPKILPIHKAQGFSYLRVVGKEVGLLFNFGSPQPEFERLFYDFEKAEKEPTAYPKVPLPSNRKLYKPEVVNGILDVAIEVHRILGSGFIHRIYANACYHECLLRGVGVVPQRSFRIIFDGDEVGEIKFNHLRLSDDVLFFPIAINCLDDINMDNIKAWLRFCEMKLAVLVNFWGTKIGYKIVVV